MTRADLVEKVQDCTGMWKKGSSEAMEALRSIMNTTADSDSGTGLK